MVSVGLLVPLHAKPGKEDDVAKFLEGGLALVCRSVRVYLEAVERVFKLRY